MSTQDSGVVHIAGPDIEIGPRLRQRCAWCGAVLVDEDLSRLMYTDDTPPDQRRPGTWRIGGLVLVDGNLTCIVKHADGDPLPDNACAALDAEVTV